MGISSATVYARMASDEEFKNQIACARAAQQEAEVDLMVEIADEATPEDWQIAKLRIWARQWRAAKLAPKRYGDKVQVEASGPGGKPIQHQVNGSIDLTMTPQQAAEAYADSLRGDD